MPTRSYIGGRFCDSRQIDIATCIYSARISLIKITPPIIRRPNQIGVDDKRCIFVVVAQVEAQVFALLYEAGGDFLAALQGYGRFFGDAAQAIFERDAAVGIEFDGFGVLGL